MAATFEQDISLFGPITQIPLQSNFEELSKENKITAKLPQKMLNQLIDKGTNCIMEKVKEIRQSFAKAVVLGNREEV